MSTHGIIQRFGEWREGGEPMVLATVYDTLGSTYTKAGHRILIAANGDYQGLVSGGCLEGDLAERARKVLETGNATTVTYDMRDDGEDLWGLGVGCNGLIRVFLQQLSPETGYEPFASIANGLIGVEAAGMAVVVASGESDLVAGATLIWDSRARSSWQLDSAQIDQLAPGCATAQEQHTTVLEVGPGGAEVLYLPLVSIPRLLVLGAGLDA
ncbi:MAG: XdhC family protein, partial [Gammaproteobacteria bacterium]|nr:XdhC family protein [Gammaproteobacteria bacterium]